MKQLVKQLAIPLSNQKTVAKWLVIAIRLGYQKTIAKSLVIAVQVHCLRRSLCVAVDAKHREPHGIPLAGAAALFDLRNSTGIIFMLQDGGKNPSCTTAEICDNPRQFVIPAQLVIPKGSKP
jgi:hypothetical protein